MFAFWLILSRIFEYVFDLYVLYVTRYTFIMLKSIIPAGPRKVISRNTLVKAEIHLENAETHLKIVQMNLQWIEYDEINLKKLNNKTKTTRFSATQM